MISLAKLVRLVKKGFVSPRFLSNMKKLNPKKWTARCRTADHDRPLGTGGIQIGLTIACDLINLVLLAIHKHVSLVQLRNAWNWQTRV